MVVGRRVDSGGLFVLDAHVKEIIGIAEMLGEPLERSVAVYRNAVSVDGDLVFLKKKHICVKFKNM